MLNILGEEIKEFRKKNIEKMNIFSIICIVTIRKWDI